MTDTARHTMRALIADAEDQGRALWLYRLDCEHYKLGDGPLREGEAVSCRERHCYGLGREVLYRVTPTTDSNLWRDWRSL